MALGHQPVALLYRNMTNRMINGTAIVVAVENLASADLDVCV